LDAEEVEIPAPANDEELLAFNAALYRFAAVELQKVELAKLRYFIGMTLEEAATVLNRSQATAKRWWTYARA
jgi:DNA-directed RNA polymerase specialized sigma24 family protein